MIHKAVCWNRKRGTNCECKSAKTRAERRRKRQFILDSFIVINFSPFVRFFSLALPKEEGPRLEFEVGKVRHRLGRSVALKTGLGSV